jgi:uncharacterized membrane protein
MGTSMNAWSQRFAFFILAASALAVAFFSLRFFAVFFHLWPFIDIGIRGVIQATPIAALTHMLVAPIALMSGPFQFLGSLRTRHPRLHRGLGRVYVAACTIAGIGALATAPYASGGPVAGFGFAVLGALWLAATLGAWRAATRRDFIRHRLLMRYSYAMTFGAVTLRLQIPIFLALGYSSYSAASVWLAYTSWIPNVIAVAVYSAIPSLRRTRAKQHDVRRRVGTPSKN